MTVIHQVDPQQVLRADKLDDFITRVREGANPPLAEVLRMDAGYFLQHAEPPDPKRAVLMAAIACEVRVKAELRERAQGKPVESLIASLLPRHPAFRLFDEPMKAVSGISMREDDRDLFSAVDLLFQRRNRLAHHGTLDKDGEPTEDVQATQAVVAVRDVGVWMRDKLPPLQ